LTSLKKEYPSSTPINKGRFHGLREEEIRGQSLTKTSLYLFFYSQHLLSLSLPLPSPLAFTKDNHQQINSSPSNLMTDSSSFSTAMDQRQK
jgi:hypothetical protein